MSNTLIARRIPFEFDDVDFFWNPSNPGFSLMANAISFMSIGFEKWLCIAFREVQQQITDPEILEECKLFIAQEGLHAGVHARHVKSLIDRYPGLAETRESSERYFMRLLDEKPLEFNICYLAALESTFPPSFKLIIDHRDVLLGDGDARVASAMLWHFCEEIEHRSSAHKIYHHVYGKRLGPTRIAGWLKNHVSEFMRITIADFRRHIPPDEWMETNERAFSKVPKWERRKALLRIMLSQAPWHNPEKEPTPDWAATWFDAYASGEDMSQYYGQPVAR